MTDDSSAMDKKNCTIPPSKSASQDLSSARSSTFKQDASNPKGNPRRRLELPVSKPNGQPRSEVATKKYSPQKNKGLDRRPRGRGGHSGESVGEKFRGPEMGSLQAPGGKKRDWDNLFHFTPRERPSHSTWQYHNTHRWRNESGGAVSKSKFSKENYLQANCQFMVKPGGDYTVYQADPDTLVDWQAIEQIIVTMVGEGASCPICLGAPVAAKMTRCGHLFCWSCMLHYLALSDQEHRPCPICYEYVCSKDLKSCVTNVHFDVELGDIITMELLCRRKDILSVCPINKNEANSEWNNMYSKLLVITHKEIADKVIERERAELQACLDEDPCCPEVCFLHQAISELSERQKGLIFDESAGCKDNVENQVVEMGEGAISLASPVLDASVSANLDCMPHQDNHYYFYQDSNGRNIFLHPLNFSMLVKSFGPEILHWPRYLPFRVIDKEYYSTSEETRKRWKFLRHLPLSTLFIVVEVDLREYVSSEILEEFASQISYRKSRREQRAKEEKQMEKIMAERERKQWKIPAYPEFETSKDFPEFLHLSEHDVPFMMGSPPLGSNEWEPIPENETVDRCGPTPWAQPSSSFAQIASRAPIKKSPSFPITGPLYRAKPVDMGEVAPFVRGARARRHSDSEPEPEDYVAVPDFRASVSDAITKALETVALEDSAQNGGDTSQKKKKKNKGKVLFATGGMGSFN